MSSILINKVIESLVRHEYGKLVSVLTRLFGLEIREATAKET